MSILDEFDRVAPVYGDLSVKLEVLLNDLLSAEQHRVHSIATRVKKRESLEAKLGKAAGKYDELGQITDLCGARIITYFEDEVGAIANLVEKEFEIDRPNSVDKRQTFDADRFGYVSVHYIASLSHSRTCLREYQRFRDLKFEIQIRSILQHAWAEIEHDLQYKSKEAIPRDLRRRFARLAGLLEIADAEFMGLRNQISSYQLHVSQTINTAPGQILVDHDSLKAFVSNNALVFEVDTEIAQLLDVPLTDGFVDLDFPLRIFDFLGHKTIESLALVLSGSRHQIVRFADKLLHRPDPNRETPIAAFGRGISLLYLAYCLILKTVPEAKIAELLDRVGFRPYDGNHDLARELFTTYVSL
jgi:ppGpp synthetase/RelA/SpoT-type nucleotidyltranferase